MIYNVQFWSNNNSRLVLYKILNSIKNALMNARLDLQSSCVRTRVQRMPASIAHGPRLWRCVRCGLRWFWWRSQRHGLGAEDAVAVAEQGRHVGIVEGETPGPRRRSRPVVVVGVRPDVGWHGSLILVLALTCLEALNLIWVGCRP